MALWPETTLNWTSANNKPAKKPKPCLGFFLNSAERFNQEEKKGIVSFQQNLSSVFAMNLLGFG